MRYIRRLIYCSIFLGIAGITVLFGYFAGTTRGSLQVIRHVLKDSINIDDAAFGSLDGNLLTGMTVGPIEIRDTLIGGVRLTAQLKRARLRLDISRFYRMELESGQIHIPERGLRIYFDRCYKDDSASVSRLAFSGVRIQRESHTDPDDVILIQSITLKFPWKEPYKADIDGARLRLGPTDAVLFSGEVDSRLFKAQAFSNGFDINRFWQWIPAPLSAGFSGYAGASDVRMTGEYPIFNIRGKIHFSSARYRRFRVYDLEISSSDLRWNAVDGTVHGTVHLSGGRIARDKTVIGIRPGQLEFTGDWQNPVLNIEGFSKIEDTRIHLTVRGTYLKPDFRLTSDPVWPEEKLLLMLATGKEWVKTEQALKEGRLSLDTAREFIDYFVLGGSGEKLMNRFGIKDVSLQLTDEVRAVSVTKEVSKKVDVSYGIEQPQTQARATGITHRVGVDYKVAADTKVSVEGKTQNLQPESGESGTDQEQTRENRLNLAVQRQF